MATAAMSTMAGGIVVMSLPWSYLSADGSPAWAGIMAATLHFPVAIGLALGGRISDRVGPRRTLIVTDALGLIFVVAGLLALGASLGEPWLVLGLIACSNLLAAPGNVAQSSRVPEMARLARTPLERANGLQEILVQAGQVLGPATGVLLVEAGGLEAALAAVTVLSSVVLFLDIALFPRFMARASKSATHVPGGAAKLLFRDSFLRTVVVVGVLLVAVFNSLDEVLAPNLALESGVGGGALAAFLFISGASALSSAAAYAYAGHRIQPMTVFVSGVWVTATGFVALATLPTAFAFTVPPLLIGAGVGPLWPIVITWIQRTVPRGMRGEVIGVLSGCVLVAQPVAALIAGPAVERFGPDRLLVGTTLLVVATAALSHVLIRRSARSPRGEARKRP
jgi:macrolide resistance protein